MTRLPHLAFAVALVVMPATAEAAKPKKPPKLVPICNMITDRKGDGRVAIIGVQNSPALDIISADFATGPKTFAAAIRLDSLQTDIWTMYSTIYRLTFAIGDAGFVLRATRGYNQADRFELETPSPAKPVDGNVNVQTATITFSGPRSLIPALKPGTKINTFTAGTYSYASADKVEPASKYVYTDRYPSCLAPK